MSLVNVDDFRDYSQVYFKGYISGYTRNLTPHDSDVFMRLPNYLQVSQFALDVFLSLNESERESCVSQVCGVVTIFLEMCLSLPGDTGKGEFTDYWGTETSIEICKASLLSGICCTGVFDFALHTYQDGANTERMIKPLTTLLEKLESLEFPCESKDGGF